MNTPHRLMQLIFVISLLATIGSLYYGYYGDPVVNIMTRDLFNKANAIPACDLCWYVRVFQYPIVIISGIALLKKDYASVIYIWPLALLGVLVSVYKYALEMGWMTEQGLCGINGGTSCSKISVIYGGFITLALLGVASCGAIMLISHLIKKHLSSVK